MGLNNDKYAIDARLELGQKIKERKKIFLDTKYWINLRDAAIGQPKEETWSILLDTLLQLQSEGKIICPISDSQFIELMATQKDSIDIMIDLVDQLSMGVSILHREERIQFELLSFFRKNLSPTKELYTSEEFIWTKLIHILGFRVPVFHDNEVKKQEKEIQEQFFKFTWNISLKEMVSTLMQQPNFSWPKRDYPVTDLNVNKIKYAGENKSYKQLFLSELGGFLDTFKPMLNEIMLYLAEQDYGISATLEEKKTNQGNQQIANLIYHLFKTGKASFNFPTFEIIVSLHALVRHDPQRKFKENDFLDFKHAEAALPYFDYFFTEKSLKHLIGKTQLDKKYNCIVISNENQALAALKTIIEI